MNPNRNKKTSKTNPALWMIILCVALSALGVLLIIFGINMMNRNTQLREICTEETTGIIIDYYETGEYKRDIDDEVHDSRRAWPIYEYQADGQTYTVQSDVYDSAGKKRYSINEAITVFYAPNNPEMHYLPGESGSASLAVWLCIGFGGLLLLFSIFAIIKFFILDKKPRKR